MTRTCVLQRGRPRCSRPPAGSPRRRHVRSGQRCQFQPDPFTLFDQRLQRAAFPGLRRVHTDGLGRLRERGGGALKRRRGRRSCVGGKRAEGVPDSAPLSARSLARATATRACRPCADRVNGTRFSECLSARLSGRLVARIREADARQTQERGPERWPPPAPLRRAVGGERRSSSFEVQSILSPDAWSKMRRRVGLGRGRNHFDKRC